MNQAAMKKEPYKKHKKRRPRRTAVDSGLNERNTVRSAAFHLNNRETSYRSPGLSRHSCQKPNDFACRNRSSWMNRLPCSIDACIAHDRQIVAV